MFEQNDNVKICGKNGCRKLASHSGNCDNYPSSAWSFFNDKDKKKIRKTGSATPRGGSKGAYQNHVSRSGKVILPYERINDCELSNYKDGYIIRLFPEQAFDISGRLHKLSTKSGLDIIVGENAFVLYRSYEVYERYPPLDNWVVRYTEDKNGVSTNARSKTVVDKGHYILRLPTVGGGSSIKLKKREEGPAQGIFAPEYADKEMTFLSKVVLAWQIVHTVNSPYTTSQAQHLKAIIESLDNNMLSKFAYFGMMRGEFTTCPLCLKKIVYSELHEAIDLQEEDGLLNSGVQVEGATRSTAINLFHMIPLEYRELHHKPLHVSWGHATCNTKLGQRRCWALEELKEENIKVAKVSGENISTFGWISSDDKMIRSPLGAVWIRISEDSQEVYDV
ncbi:BstXI family restriction endonuclease [Vibrio alginolyticus]|nr:BstXI family restriction endonuclease [Vibrio alginolyticus]